MYCSRESSDVRLWYVGALLPRQPRENWHHAEMKLSDEGQQQQQSYRRDLKSNMGITKLANLIHFDAPDSVLNREIGDYSGKFNAVLFKWNKQIDNWV